MKFTEYSKSDKTVDLQQDVSPAKFPKSTFKNKPENERKNSDIFNLQSGTNSVKEEDEIKELQNWLFQRAADRLASVKTNDERVLWIKFACMIDSVGKILFA